MIYDKDSIQVLDGREAIRKRPAMYIGSIRERGLLGLLSESCRMLFEELNASELAVDLLGEGRYSVRACGPAVSSDGVQKYFEPMEAGDGGRLLNWLFVLNALSSSMQVTTNSLQLLYEKGKLVEEKTMDANGIETELTFVFTIEAEVLQARDISFHAMNASLFVAAALCGKKRYQLTSGTGEHRSFTSNYVEGLLDLAYEKQFLPQHSSSNPILGSFEIEGMSGDVLMVPAYQGKQLSYVNGIPSPGGGSHVKGVIEGIIHGTKKLAAEKGQELKHFTGKEVIASWLLIVAIRAKNPVYGSPTTDRLEMDEKILPIAAKVADMIAGK